MQRVDHGIAALLVFLVAGRQKDDDIAIDGIAFEIAFEGCAVDLDVLDRDRLCSGDDVGNIGLHLSDEPRSRCDSQCDCARSEQLR